MDIIDDERASKIWWEIFDKTPDGCVSIERDGAILKDAFDQLRALGYDKADCNEFLNCNLSECEPA